MPNVHVNLIPSQNSLRVLMTSEKPIYQGSVNVTTLAFKTKWADVADLIFAETISRLPSNDPAPFRASFIAALVNAAENSTIRVRLEEAFLAYLQAIETENTINPDDVSLLVPVRPNIADFSQMFATMGQLESNVWAADGVSKALYAWAVKYTEFPTLAVAAIVGVTPIYVGATTAGTRTYTNATAGGSWSVSEASGHFSVNGATGVVTAISAGTGKVQYLFTNEFGNAVGVETTVEIITLPAIAGLATVAAAATITLTNDIAGGTWASSDPTKATVAAGVVTGVAAGSTNITYTMPDGARVTKAITVTA